MNRCCFCLDLRSGTIASAVFVLITRTLVIVLFSTILGLRQQRASDLTTTQSKTYEDLLDTPWYYQINVSNVRLIITVGISCFHFLFSVVLLIGVKQKKKSLFCPWIALFGLEISLGLGFVITTFVLSGFVGVLPRIATMMISILFECYMLACVVYYYKQLASRDNVMYNIVPLSSPNANQVTNTSTPFYRSAGLYYNPPDSSPDQPPKYETLASSFNKSPSQYDKPPPYDDCKGN